MRIFRCGSCQHRLFFENVVCVRCGAALGFDPERRELVAVEPRGDALGEVGNPDAGAAWLRCANEQIASCNWLVPATQRGYCVSCRLTRTRPHDADADGLAALARAETAKRRLVFQLLELGLPLVGHEAAKDGLAFDLLWEPDGKVVTGHEDGVITLDLRESDDARRERLRVELGEPYRTLLGHFRHEIGHYYWSLLVPPGEQGGFRALFGDESVDYGEALEHYYANGPPAAWRDRFVSEYATMHPHEDWAESFAHYLHITDVLQTAEAFEMEVAAPEKAVEVPPHGSDFEAMLDAWVPLTVALNAVNRSLGKGDLYPFVLSPAAIEKLHYVHARIAQSAS